MSNDIKIIQVNFEDNPSHDFVFKHLEYLHKMLSAQGMTNFIITPRFGENLRLTVLDNKIHVFDFNNHKYSAQDIIKALTKYEATELNESSSEETIFNKDLIMEQREQM